MTPSRWLFFTAAATAAATSILITEPQWIRGVVVSALLVTLYIRWRPGWRAVFVCTCIFAGLAFRIHVSPTLEPAPPEIGWVGNVREDFVEKLIAAMPEREARLGAGMLLGDVAEPAKDLVQSFRRAGINHLLAVSGGNLAVVLTFISILGASRFSKTTNMCVVLVVAPAFCLLTNVEASILRASVMAGLAVVVQRLGRPAQAMNVLVAAALLLVWVWPGLLWESVGFQLSLAATFGLVAFSGPLEEQLARHLPSSIATVLAATLGATLATLPPSLVTFGQVSIIGPFVNIIVVPLVPLVMACVGAVAGMSILLPFLATYVGSAAWAVLHAIELVVLYASRLPAASVLLPSSAALGLAGIITFASLRLSRRHVRPLFD
ncbi:MAG: ComEC/Rec2 family competence protein [Patescibacteria group bacterium]